MGVFTFENKINSNGKTAHLKTEEKSPKNYFVKVILLGDRDVGKTKLLRLYCKCFLCCQDVQTQRKYCQMSHHKQLQLQDITIQLRLCDTAGKTIRFYPVIIVFLCLIII